MRENTNECRTVVPEERTAERYIKYTYYDTFSKKTVTTWIDMLRYLRLISAYDEIPGIGKMPECYHLERPSFNYKDTTSMPCTYTFYQELLRKGWRPGLQIINYITPIKTRNKHNKIEKYSDQYYYWRDFNDGHILLWFIISILFNLFINGGWIVWLFSVPYVIYRCCRAAEIREAEKQIFNNLNKK